MFYPCHKNKKKKNKKNKNKNPPPKSIGWGCTRRLKFDAETSHGLLAEFRGLGVQVKRRTRRTSQSTITEHTKNLIVTQRRCLLTQTFFEPKIFSDPNFFRAQIFSDSDFFQAQIFVGPKIFCDPKFFWN